jgi:hypothetical protein
MELESRKSPENLAVLVIGTDTLIETLPARPIQLAHACGALGFDLVVPLSWGDELVAEAALRTLESRAQLQAIFCSCPLVRQRLLQAGSDLGNAMVSLVPSPVALARHLRATMGVRLGSLSFVGRCPSAVPPDYDAAYEPTEFLDLLRARGIQVQQQPDVFFDRIPPDRRRFVSLPGGCPTPEALWQRCNERMLVEMEESPDLPIELAQQMISPQPILVDAATALGCWCSGVTPSATGYSVRVAATSLEPPRSTTPIVTDAVIPELTEAVGREQSKSFDTSEYEGTPSTPARPPMAVTPPTALPVRK